MFKEYLNCEYTLHGEDAAVFSFNQSQYPDRPVLDQNTLDGLRASSNQAQDDKYGLALFDAVFPPGSKLEQGLRDAQAVARNSDQGLRLRFCINATRAEWHGLHWEMLRDPTDQSVLSCAPDSAFSRFVYHDSKPPAPATTKPRILVVMANPADIEEKFRLPKLDRTQQTTDLKKELDRYAAQFNTEFLESPMTVSRIRGKLSSGDFHALHIVSHGVIGKDQRAALILEDPEGNAELVDEDRFANLVQGVRTLRLVTLIACHGGAQLANDSFGGLSMALVRRYVPAVVAMRQAVSVRAAQVFTEYFYQQLAATGLVDAAVNEARNQLRLNFPQSSEWATPVLFMRLAEGCISEPSQGSVPRTSFGFTEVIPWNSIKTHLQRGRVVPVIGPDVTRGIFLSPRDIAQSWASHYDTLLQNQQKTFPFLDARDLPRVSKYVDIMDGTGVPHFSLLDLLKENLLDRVAPARRDQLKDLRLREIVAEVAPHFFQDEDEPHLLLAKLPVTTYITTNYDSFMFEALRWQKIKARQEYCHWEQAPENEYPDYKQYRKLIGSKEERLVFHLYGYDDPNTMVLTEDDYFNFLKNLSRDDWRMPPLITGAMGDSILLFLGFSITDLDFRVLWKSAMQARKTSERDLPRIVVLQISPESVSPQEEALRDFQEKCCSQIKLIVYPGTVREFLKELS